MPKSPILGGFSTTRSPNASASEAINIATEVVDTHDGKVPGFLFGTSGLDLIISVGSGPVRGILPLLGLLYVVSGPNVYSIGPTGTVVLVGTISAQNSPVSMFANTQQLMIVDGVGAWLVPGGFPLAAGTISLGGGLYAIGDTITLLATSGNQSSFPVLMVTSTDAGGAVTSFSVTQAGAIDSPAASFTQKSTSGSGSGFVLASPSYGSFLGLIPVSLPFANPMVGGVMDGFGLLVFLGQQVIACSAQGDLSTWPALNFGIANQSPDTNITLAINHDEAYILKTTNAEVWTNLGTANFPFGPLGGVHMQSGCVAPFSVAVADEALIWLSRNSQGQGIVVMAKAYQVEPISTQAMVSEIQTYPQIGDAIAYVRQEGQHVFYVITFPQADKTWVFDKTASEQVGYPLWHRLAAFSKGTFKRHWGNCFYPWPQAIVAQIANASYQAQAVTITYPTKLQTSSGLNGLPTAFSSFVFSLWVDIPDSVFDSLYFSNQTDDTHGTTNPGLFINIQNDITGTPQITIRLWDGGNSTILSATYNFTTWATWTNILISVDTATQKIQVWASTLVSEVLVETQLTPVSLTWSSNNAIGASATQPWHLALKNVP